MKLLPTLGKISENVVENINSTSSSFTYVVKTRDSPGLIERREIISSPLFPVFEAEMPPISTLRRCCCIGVLD